MLKGERKWKRLDHRISAFAKKSFGNNDIEHPRERSHRSEGVVASPGRAGRGGRMIGVWYSTVLYSAVQYSTVEFRAV